MSVAARSFRFQVFQGRLMSELKYVIAGTPVLGRGLLMLYRAKIGLGTVIRPVLDMFGWLLRSREISNFTYDLEEENTRYLAALISHITGVGFDDVMGYIREVQADDELRRHISEGVAASDLAYMADKDVRYGRRIGWYVVARIIKPKVVVETGVDKGLGSCLLTAALKRNNEEGHAGRYFGTDLNPRAGYLLTGDYARHGEILYGDSIESLKKLEGPIDLFINDSDHSAEYEAEEYRVIQNKLAANAMVLGDNSHCTDKLLEFSLSAGRHFLFFKEVPKAHWYPGAGIGFSFVR
jgi:hypothetical protein